MRYKVKFFEEDARWLAEIPDVGGGMVTQGKTLEETREMARDAVTRTLLARRDLGQKPDPPTRGALPASWEWVYPDARVKVAMASAGSVSAET